MASQSVLSSFSTATSQHTLGNLGNPRLACDRCRRYKVRCERSRDTTNEVSIRCQRCQNLNIKCITSTARKSGRPSKGTLQQGDNNGTSGRRQPRQSQDRSAQGDGREQDGDLAQDGLPTPPPTSFSTPPETSRNGADVNGDISMQTQPSMAPSGGFHSTSETYTQDASGADVSNDHQQSTTTPSSNPTDIHLKPLTKLADLQANLLVDIDLVKHTTSADKCDAAYAAKNLVGSEPSHQFVLGRMFEHAKTLLEVVECFSPPSRIALTYASPLNSSTSSSTPSTSNNQTADIPTLLTLCTCYIHIIRIYRTILASIHDSFHLIPSTSTLNPTPIQLPHLFPAINLNNFTVQPSLAIQVQILVEVCEDLLSKIHAKFGMLDDDSASTTGSIIQNPGTKQILLMMLDQEALEQPPLNDVSGRGYCDPLPGLMGKLKRMVQHAAAGKLG